MASKSAEPADRPFATAASDQPAAGCTALQLPAGARVLLASDMHLGEHDAPTAQWFCQCLAAQSAGCTHLILLGDLFEAWTGDDQNDPVAGQLLSLLQTLRARLSISVMRGNRDFLLDLPIPGQTGHASFSEQYSITMLADPCLLSLGEQRWLLSHGDMFCTDDVAYQAFRQQSRQRQWTDAFLGQTLAERTALAARMREQSNAEKANKAENLTDVNEAAALAGLRAWGVTELIHGHTHRPAHHESQHEGTTYRRHVLPDWDAASGRGGFMQLSAGGLIDIPAQQT